MKKESGSSNEAHRVIELLGTYRTLDGKRQPSSRWMKSVLPVKRSAEAKLVGLQQQSSIINTLRTADRQALAAEIAAVAGASPTPRRKAGAPNLWGKRRVSHHVPQPPLPAAVPPPQAQAQAPAQHRPGFCPECGRGLPPGAAFCTGCGTRANR